MTNAELIAVNQDKEGLQGFKIIDKGNFEIWQKPLANGDIAVAFLNLDDREKQYEIDWANIKIKGFSGHYEIKDLWLNRMNGNTKNKMSIIVPSRDVWIVRLKK